MTNEPIRNSMHQGEIELRSAFDWWKRGAKAVFILLPIYTLFLGAIERNSQLEVDATSLWMISYYALLMIAIALPMLAPKEIRHFANDTNIMLRAATNGKMSLKRLFFGISAEPEAEAVLDHREQLLRHKAIAASYPITSVILAMMLGSSFAGEASIFAGGITSYSVILLLVVHGLVPAAYLVWTHKPLSEFDD